MQAAWNQNHPRHNYTGIGHSCDRDIFAVPAAISVRPISLLARLSYVITATDEPGTTPRGQWSLNAEFRVRMRTRICHLHASGRGVERLESLNIIVTLLRAAPRITPSGLRRRLRALTRTEVRQETG